MILLVLKQLLLCYFSLHWIITFDFFHIISFLPHYTLILFELSTSTCDRMSKNVLRWIWETHASAYRYHVVSVAYDIAAGINTLFKQLWHRSDLHYESKKRKSKHGRPSQCMLLALPSFPRLFDFLFISITCSNSPYRLLFRFFILTFIFFALWKMNNVLECKCSKDPFCFKITHVMVYILLQQSTSLHPVSLML